MERLPFSSSVSSKENTLPSSKDITTFRRYNYIQKIHTSMFLVKMGNITEMLGSYFTGI